MKELPIWVYPDGCDFDNNEHRPKTEEEFKKTGIVYKPLSSIMAKCTSIPIWGHKSCSWLPKPLEWACRGCTENCLNRRCKLGGEPTDN